MGSGALGPSRRRPPVVSPFNPHATQVESARVNARKIVIYLCACWMTWLLIRDFQALGRPYFDIPETIFDHVLPVPPPTRDVIVLAREIAPLMPNGATLTVVQPALAPDYDFTDYLAAAGQLPRHRVLHPTLAEGEPWPDFVLAIGAPLQHRGYALVREFPKGRLYAVRR